MSHWFRHGDPAYPPFWESSAQPAARWHAAGEGPVQYLADTPTGAWAEFLRHEAITDLDDLADVTRILWTVYVPEADETAAAQTRPELQVDLDTLAGGSETYPDCQAEANRLRADGARGLMVTSAALRPDAAAGWCTNGGRVPAEPADGMVLVLFGARPDLVAWWAGGAVPPDSTLLERVAPLT